MRGEKTISRTPVYDAIIYGEDIESLTIGSLLAKRGEKVLILAFRGEAEHVNFLSHDGFLFDPYPCFWPATDPHQLHPALAELGISADFQLLDPGFQLVLPRHRLSFMGEEDLFWQEIRREFPHLIENIALFLRRMEVLRERMEKYLQQEFTAPPRTLRTRWAQMKNVPFPFSSLFREGKASLSPHMRILEGDRQASLMVDSLLLGFGGVKAENCNALFASLILSLLRKPIYYPSEGAKGIYEALLASFLKNGGEFRSTAQSAHLILERRKVRGLDTAEGEEFRGKIFIGGAGLWQMYMAAKSQEEGIRSEGRLPLIQTLTLFLGVDQEVLPQEMRENLLLVPDSTSSSAGENPIWITMSPSWDGMRAPQGKRALTISLSLTSNSPEIGMDLEAKRAELMRDLEDFLPFLRQHIHFQQSHLYQSFSMLETGRKWGFKVPIPSLKQAGYPGHRRFSLQKNLHLIGDLPINGIGLRARIDAGYYWANLLGPSMEG